MKTKMYKITHNSHFSSYTVRKLFNTECERNEYVKNQNFSEIDWFQLDEVEVTTPEKGNGSVIAFRVTAYYDPYGDGKSGRKIFKHYYYFTSLSESEVKHHFDVKNACSGYYGEVTVAFMPTPKNKKAIMFQP
jgi:hypothetical protein